MRFCTMSILSLALAMFWASINSAGQPSDAIDAHVAAAREAAGQEHVALFKTVCTPATTPRPPAEPPTSRSSWYTEPVKVFDNLYFVGQGGALGLGSDYFGRHYYCRCAMGLLRRG